MTQPASKRLLTEANLTTEGLLAARPAASARVGFYYATDDNGGTLYRSNGTTWLAIAPGAASIGQELGYSEITSTFTGTTGVEVAVTGLAVTFTAPGTPVIAEFWGLAEGATADAAYAVHLSMGTYSAPSSYVAEVTTWVEEPGSSSPSRRVAGSRQPRAPGPSRPTCRALAVSRRSSPRPTHRPSSE
jgi:hypothetical protein